MSIYNAIERARSCLRTVGDTRMVQIQRDDLQALLTAIDNYDKTIRVMVSCPRASATSGDGSELREVKRLARQMCEDDGLDPDEHIVGGQATAFEDYGPRWQADERSEGQLGITDYSALARAALATPDAPRIGSDDPQVMP